MFKRKASASAFPRTCALLFVALAMALAILCAVAFAVAVACADASAAPKPDPGRMFTSHSVNQQSLSPQLIHRFQPPGQTRCLTLILRVNPASHPNIHIDTWVGIHQYSIEGQYNS